MLIACATDRQYVEMTGVLIRSIYSQQHSEDVKIFVFCYLLSEEDKANLSACADPHTPLTFIDLDGDAARALKDLISERHLSIVAYSRIMIPDMLADHRGRLVYFDCDVVVNAPLDELFALDMQGFPAGAVSNAVTTSRLAELNTALRRPVDTPYFNSGVLLIDLDEWRRQQIGQRGMEFAKTWMPQGGDHDQAVLNSVLSGNWLSMDQKWNYNPMRLSAEEAMTMPIQHFWGKLKPFYADYPVAHGKLYDQYRAETPWAAAPRGGRWKRSLKKQVRRIVSKSRSLINGLRMAWSR
jgi:lipopolysaccharide biosynthesis glycosyltransferase